MVAARRRGDWTCSDWLIVAPVCRPEDGDVATLGMRA
jgi:hypothetical protein